MLFRSRRQVEVPVWRLEMNDGETMASMIYSDNGGFDVNARIYVVKDGKVTVDLEPDAAIIVKSVERGY